MTKKKTKKKNLNYKKIRAKALTPPKGKVVHKATREFYVLCQKLKKEPSEKTLYSYYWKGSNCKNCIKVGLAHE